MDKIVEEMKLINDSNTLVWLIDILNNLTENLIELDIKIFI